jgi:hypothetical protein
VKPNEYRCAICSGVFEKGQTDEEAAAELIGTFPGYASSECDLVCDDCFNEHFAWTRAQA